MASAMVSGVSVDGIRIWIDVDALCVGAPRCDGTFQGKIAERSPWQSTKGPLGALLASQPVGFA